MRLIIANSQTKIIVLDKLLDAANKLLELHLDGILLVNLQDVVVLSQAGLLPGRVWLDFVDVWKAAGLLVAGDVYAEAVEVGPGEDVAFAGN